MNRVYNNTRFSLSTYRLIKNFINLVILFYKVTVPQRERTISFILLKGKIEE